MLWEHEIECIHPTSVFKPKRVIGYPIHPNDFILVKYGNPLCDVFGTRIPGDDRIEQLVEDRKIIIAGHAEIIDSGLIIPGEMIAKKGSNKILPVNGAAASPADQ